MTNTIKCLSQKLLLKISKKTINFDRLKSRGDCSDSHRNTEDHFVPIFKYLFYLPGGSISGADRVNVDVLRLVGETMLHQSFLSTSFWLRGMGFCLWEAVASAVIDVSAYHLDTHVIAFGVLVSFP